MTVPVMRVFGVGCFPPLLPLPGQGLDAAQWPHHVRQGVGLNVQIQNFSHCDSVCMHARACKRRGTVQSELDFGWSCLHKVATLARHGGLCGLHALEKSGRTMNPRLHRARAVLATSCRVVRKVVMHLEIVQCTCM